MVEFLTRYLFTFTSETVILVKISKTILTPHYYTRPDGFKI